MKKVGEGEGTLGTDYVLLVNEEKVAELEKNRGEGLSEIRERGEMNYITGAEIGRIRGSGLERAVCGDFWIELNITHRRFYCALGPLSFDYSLPHIDRRADRMGGRRTSQRQRRKGWKGRKRRSRWS